MKFVSKEDKELLLKDISQRLPYGVKVKIDNIHILRPWNSYTSR